MKKEWVYGGAFLDETSKEIIRENFKEYIPEGWKELIDHYTIVFNDNSEGNDEWKKWVEKNIGKTVELDIISIGVSDKAIAVGAIGVPSRNEHPHITLAVGNGGKPVDSNKIINWSMIENPFLVSAKIDFFPHKKY